MITIQIGKLNKAYDGYIDQVTRLEFDSIQDAMSIWSVLVEGISSEVMDQYGEVHPYGYQVNHCGKIIHFGYSH